MIPQIPDSRCNATCSKDSTEICGGKWVSNVYQVSAFNSIAGNCYKAPNVLSVNDVDFDLIMTGKTSPFITSTPGTWRGWTLKRANSLNGIPNPSSLAVNWLLGDFLTLARFGSLNSWGIMLKGTYPIYMALSV